MVPGSLKCIKLVITSFPVLSSLSAQTCELEASLLKLFEGTAWPWDFLCFKASGHLEREKGTLYPKKWETNSTGRLKAPQTHFVLIPEVLHSWAYSVYVEVSKVAHRTTTQVLFA